MKHEFEMILEQRNYYSNQTEYFGSVVRRLDENSTRYHRRGTQLVEAYEQEQRATDELLRIYGLSGPSSRRWRSLSPGRGNSEARRTRQTATRKEREISV